MSAERGQTTVELALALPVVMFVVAALVEVGFLVSDQVRLAHAAREAARVAVVERDRAPVSEAVQSLGFEAAELTVEPGEAMRRQGAPLTVRLAYDRPGALPLVGALFSGVELNARTTMRIENP
jgi:hypothetical protein